MKGLLERWQWHVAVIMLALFSLSFLSWTSFGLKAISRFVKLENAAGRTAMTLNDTDNAAKRTAMILNDTDNAAERKVITSNNTNNAEEIISGSLEEGRIRIAFDKLDSAIQYFDSKWYNNIFKKSYLSKIDSIISYYATGELFSNQVALGSNNWLFYKSKTDGDPIGDYEGANLYSRKEMYDILQKALSTQKTIEDRGIEFVILVTPNKENIYSEYMPDIYVHSGTSRTDLLVGYLYDNGVNVVSPKIELLDDHLNYQIYYPYDTHWNQLGAYIGVKNALAVWDISLPELSDRTISAKLRRADSDLMDMIGGLSIFDDEIEYEVDGTFLDFDRYTLEKDQNSGQISHIIHDQAKKQAKLFLVGDSFRTAMIPALGEIFSDIYIVHRSYYTVGMLDDIDPDYLIAECVERYSDSLRDIDFLVK